MKTLAFSFALWWDSIVYRTGVKKSSRFNVSLAQFSTGQGCEALVSSRVAMFPSLVYVLEKTPLCGEKLGGRRSKQKCSALTKLLVRRLSCCVEDGERVREMDSPFSLKNKKSSFSFAKMIKNFRHLLLVHWRESLARRSLHWIEYKVLDCCWFIAQEGPVFGRI